jgi:hypothetical protein
MTADFSPVLLLATTGIVGLLLIPLGLPALWVIVLGILGYGLAHRLLTPERRLIALVVGLALPGEVFEA